MRRDLLLVIFILLCSVIGFSQPDESFYSINVNHTSTPIILDGIIDEASWLEADSASTFTQHFPADTSSSQSLTTVWVTFDDDYFYVAAKCYDTIKKDYIIQSLKRDFSYPVSDAFAVFIDPFNDGQNGFSFSVNPLGVQREGLLENGGSFGVSTAWDNKWFSEVHIDSGYWSLEMAIPFKTLRYNSNVQQWGINFSRNNLKINEGSVWSPVPRNFNVANLAFTGKLNWKEQPEKAGSNIVLIPFITNASDIDYQSDKKLNNKPNGGLDAKIAVSSSLNLDVTINPDFSQVEVDQQVTNLSRFSLFYPERRNFFIENSDLFSRFGFRQIRPFFSRRIGLKDGSPIPILAGARLSGKVNSNLRIGLMNMQTEGVASINEDPQNYSVGALQYQLFTNSKNSFLQRFSRSYLGFIGVNKQGFSGTKINKSDYNRIAGVDLNIASTDNLYQGKLFYHHSFNTESTNKSYAHASWLAYDSRNWFIMWNHEYVGENYLAEVGFVPRISYYNPETNQIDRKSYWRLEPMVTYKFYPKNSKVNYYSPGVYLSDYYDDDFMLTERYLQGRFDISFINSSAINIRGAYNEVLLYYDTDITFSGNTPIDSGRYSFNNMSVAYNSNTRKLVGFDASVDYGSYYIGNKLSYGGSLSYRLQPWGKFSISLNQNDIFMPKEFESTSLTLVGTRIDLSFTKSLFFTSFIQYNTQAQNTNFNTRIQWRFKPMSDIYLVYTENYLSENFSIKNRALVFKLVYWLNV